MHKRKSTKSYEEFLDSIVQDDPAVADHLFLLRPRTRMEIPQSNVARLESPLGNMQTTESLLAYAEACGLKLGVVFMEKADDRYVLREATAISSDEEADKFLQEAVESV